MYEDRKDFELEKIREAKRQELIEKSKEKETAKPIVVTDANFDEAVEVNSFIVVDFWASWCGPCKIMSPIIDELAKAYTGKIAFGKLNVDENPETASRFNVMGIPTLLIMRNGREVDRMVGVAHKTVIEEKLKKHL